MSRCVFLRDAWACALHAPLLLAALRMRVRVRGVPITLPQAAHPLFNLHVGDGCMRQSQRPVIAPNLDFMGELMEYESTLGLSPPGRQSSLSPEGSITPGAFDPLDPFSSSAGVELAGDLNALPSPPKTPGVCDAKQGPGSSVVVDVVGFPFPDCADQSAPSGGAGAESAAS